MSVVPAKATYIVRVRKGVEAIAKNSLLKGAFSAGISEQSEYSVILVDC